MCFYVEIGYSAQQLQNRYQITSVPNIPTTGKLNAYAHPQMLMLDKHYEPIVSHWGLIPHWCKDPEKAKELQKMTLNARAETAHQKPSFRDAFKKNRCLIPVSGFYEWEKTGKPRKQPWQIVVEDSTVFSLAGIYETWVNPIDETAYTGFSILTCSANAHMSQIHTRMPVIINQEDELQWLEQGSPTLLKPYEPDNLLLMKIE